MKSSILLSITMATLLFMGNAKAKVIPEVGPGIPKTFSECIQTGGSTSACETLFSGLKKCERIHSADEEGWKDCIAEAEATFHQALGTTPADVPYEGETIPVSTNAADSRYEQKDPEHKGYMNAEE